MLEKLGLIPISEIIKNKSIQNFLFLAIIQSSNVLITIISMPLLIQGLGVDQFGLVNLALSVIVLLNIIVGFGYNLSAPREVAISQQNKEALSHIVSNIFSAKLALATIAGLAILIAVYGFGLFQNYQIILVYSLMLLFSEATLPLWFFQGMEKMKLVSIANIFSKLLFLMGIVLFIHSPEMSKWVNFMMGIFGLLINLSLLAYIHIFLQIKFYRPQFSAIWASLKENLLLFFSNLTGYMSVNGGLIIFSFFTGAETLGMYSLAERVVMVLRIFPPMVIQAILPNASKLYNHKKNEFFKFLMRIYRNMLGFSILISLSSYFLAPFTIEVLAKSSYSQSILFLQVLSFVPFLSCLNAANVTLLLVANLKKILFKVGWIVCLYMVIASTILTYYFEGVGLCFGILTTEIIAYITCMVLLRTQKPKLFHGFYS